MNKREKFIIWCDKAMAFSFYALIYFLPISIALTEMFTVTALVAYLTKRGFIYHRDVRKESASDTTLPFWKKARDFLIAFKPVSNCLNWPITFFLVFNLVSVILSKYRYVSFEGFMGKSLQSAFIYFNFIECINTRKRMKTFLTVFTISGILICINGLYQHFVGHGFIHGHLAHDGRISSSLRAHNDFAGYLIPFIPLLLVISLHECFTYTTKFTASRFSLGIGKRAGMLTVTALAIVCLGLTYSRGAWIAFIVVAALLGLLRKRSMFMGFIVIVVFFGVFYPQLKSTRRVGFMVDFDLKNMATQEDLTVKADEVQRPTAPEEGFGAQNIYTFLKGKLKTIKFFGASGRSEYWKEAVNIFKDYSVFGVGLNTYSLIGKRYKITWGGYPHNCYLQMAVETGTVGLASFLWIVFTVFKVSFKKIKKMRDPFLQAVLLGSLAGYGGFLVHSAFDTNFYSVQLGSLMWIVMGLIVAIQKIETNDKDSFHAVSS